MPFNVGDHGPLGDRPIEVLLVAASGTAKHSVDGKATDPPKADEGPPTSCGWGCVFEVHGSGLPRGATALDDGQLRGSQNPEIRAWRGMNLRPQVYFMPSSASWPNLVDVHFGIIKRQTLLRADVALVPELNKTIRDFVTGWSDRVSHIYEDQDQRRNFQKTQPLKYFKKGH